MTWGVHLSVERLSFFTCDKMTMRLDGPSAGALKHHIDMHSRHGSGAQLAHELPIRDCLAVTKYSFEEKKHLAIYAL